MARAAVSRQVVPATGLNLIDGTYTTMSTGAGNGVEIPYQAGMFLALKNDTGGAAAFTIKVPSPAGYSGKGSTVGDITVTVATAKTWLWPVTPILKQSDGDIYVDCDVAGKIACYVFP